MTRSAAIVTVVACLVDGQGRILVPGPRSTRSPARRTPTASSGSWSAPDLGDGAAAA